MSKIIFTEEATKPPAPSVGQVSLYVKTDEVAYIQDSAGVETPIGVASGITALTGDVSATGPGSATATINFVGGQSALNVANATIAFLAATSVSTPNTLVLRDGSANFSANTITASLNGNATTSTNSITSVNFTGSLSGDVTGTQSATVVSIVGGQTASAVANAATAVAAATPSNIASTLVLRNASGNFSANIITASLNGNAATATNATTAVNFTGSLSGDVIGTQGATAIASIVVTSKLLTSYITGANTPILATDSILTAFEKTQGQINATIGAAITQLTGDVTAIGPGSAAATIAAIQGTAVSGTTGTGNVVFSNAPTLTGLLNGGSANFTGAITASNFSGSSSGANTGDVTVINTNSINLSFGSGQTNLEADLNLSTDAADANNLKATTTIHSGAGKGLHVEYPFGTPVQIGTANNTGAASGFALYDHVHNHGNQTVPTQHAIATGSANGFMSSTDKNKLDGLSNIQNIVIVQLTPVTGQFSSIAAAIASITTASISNPFLVTVGPGIYVEPQIAMKPYVYVSGAGFDSTVITPSNPATHLIVGADFSALLRCELTGVTGSGQALIYHSSATGTSQTCFYVEEVRFGASDTLVLSSGNNTASLSTVSTNSCRFGSIYSFNTGFHATTTGSNPGKIEIRDLLASGMQTPYPADVFLADAVNCEIVMNSVQCRSGGTTTGNCIRVRNGALLRILSLDLKGFGKGLWAENVGAGPIIELGIANFENNTIDLQLDHVATQGVINVAASLASSNITTGITGLALVILDTSTGAINVSNAINIQQADGIFTDATSLALEGGTMGVFVGGDLTIVSGLTVNAASGHGYLDTAGLTPIVGSIHKVNWPSTNITLTANSNNYIYFNTLGVLSIASSLPDTAANILIGRVVTNSSGVDFIDDSTIDVAHYGNTNDDFIRNALGSVFAYGCIVTENATPLHLDATAGSYYFGNNNFMPSVKTNTVFQTFYQNGSGGYIIGSTNTVDTSHYDNGSGTLQLIPSGQFARHTLYLVGQGVNQQYLFVYAQITYASLVLAQTGNIPTPPPYFTDGVVLISSIIVKQGSTSIVAGGGQIVDNRPRIGFALPAVESVGTVTSVALVLPISVFNVSGSPITSSGTLTGSLNTQTANTVWAGPTTGAAASPTFRALVSADIPPINLASSVNGGVTGILPNSNTTGASSSLANTLVLRDASSNFSAGTITANLIGNASGSSASFTGSLAGDITGTQSTALVSKIQGTTVSSTTGTTNVVFSASPTLTGTITAASANFSGAIAINNSSTSALTINTTSFVFDSVNNAIGIGTQPSSVSFIDAVNSTAASKTLQLTGYGTGSTVGTRGRFARGTSGSPTAAQIGDTINFWSARGYGTSQFATASTAAINAIAGENFTNTSNLTYLAFDTTPTGSVTSTENMRVASTGVTLGPQTASTSIHQINGGFYRTNRTITTNLTIDTTTTDDIVFCNQSGAISITLPTPTNGRTIVIKDISGTTETNNITVIRHASEKIEGLASSRILYTNFGTWTFTSDGTNWWIL